MRTTERLINRLAERGSQPRHQTPRRGFLAGAALTGAAIAASPVSYLTRPADAYTSLCGPDAECDAGYSAMCCTINNGANSCPPGTFVGGWWKADRSSFCGGAARYYIDCNASKGSNYHCHCNSTTCDHRLVACNVFRYGQCNTQIPGVTAVVCRVVSCTPPWQLYPGACSTSSATDNNTAGHTAPCLTAKPYPAAPSSLAAGHQLTSGQRLTSPDRRSTAIMQSDGNFVVYGAGSALWQTRTSNKAVNGRLVLQTDGNLVLRRTDNVAAWTSATNGTGSNGTLTMQNDQNLVLYVGGRARWSTRT
jgi:hypothetical protein